VNYLCLVKLSILCFFGYNFWTRNARKPIKGSKNSYFSLVYTKNTSKIIPSCSWGPLLDNLGQKGWNQPPLWHHPQKPWNPKPINFYSFQLNDLRVLWGFQQLPSTINWWVMELQSGMKIAAQCMILKYDMLVHWLPTC